ncbi:MAG: transposase, partial [Candidatus Omnitrophota bacterium]
FRLQEDYLVYLSLLRRFKRKYKFKVYAYCLMPNHVHILGEIGDRRMLSSFMHDLNMTYTRYFNGKHEKVGHLWQGRFKNKVIAKDEYLIQCFNYVEFNPVRAQLTQSPSEYPWNSYHARVLGKNDRLTDTLVY